MNKIYLLLGSNQQSPQKQLLLAQKLIAKKIGPIKRKSAIYQTAAWGNTNQPDFLNQVIIVETKLPAQQTMQIILQIEKKMGRLRTVKNAPRIIDIDILFFNKEIINEKKTYCTASAITKQALCIGAAEWAFAQFEAPCH